MRLRIGDSTEADWHLLLTRQPLGLQNMTEIHDATRSYFLNEDVALFNYYCLTALHQPIARINSRHSSSLAKSATADDMLGLEPVHAQRHKSTYTQTNIHHGTNQGD